MSTFTPLGRPLSTGRTPACPAIKSHEVIAVMTAEEPPTAPRCPRKRRRVHTGCERMRLLRDYRSDDPETRTNPLRCRRDIHVSRVLCVCDASDAGSAG